MIKIGIITIGDEILRGKTLDLNKANISKKVNLKGLEVSFAISCNDKKLDIKESLEFILKKSNFIFVTGGLGPTSDDITYESVKEVFKYKTINYYKNQVGIADAIELINDTHNVILLPGPPNENLHLLDIIIEKYFISSSNLNLYRIIGYKEKEIDDYLKSKKVKNYGVYLDYNIVDLFVNRSFTNIVINKYKDDIFANDLVSIHKVVIDLLIEKNLTISIVESATGGMLASKIVDIKNASKVLLSSLVLYSEEAKIKEFNVEKQIREYGSVSKEITNILAKKNNSKYSCDISVAITGYADEGKFYVAIIYNNKLYESSYKYNFTRNINRVFLTNTIMDNIRRIIK